MNEPDAKPAKLRMTRPPETELQRRDVRKLCRTMAKRSGFRGQDVEVEADRLYLEALEECQKKVRDPDAPAEPKIVVQPPTGLFQRQLERGMKQTDSGLYIPEGS